MAGNGGTPELGHELACELLELVPAGLVVWSLARADCDDLTLLYANRAASQLTGVSLAHGVGTSARALFPDAPHRVEQLIAETCRDGVSRKLGRFDYRAPGNQHTAKLCGSIEPLAQGRALVLLQSVASLERAEDEARKVNQFLDSILEHLPAMMFLKDGRELRFERFNRAGEELLGVPREHVLGKTDYELFPVEQAEFFVEHDRAVLRDGVLRDIPSEPIRTPHGTRWLHTRKIPIYDPQGAPQHLLGISIDVTDQKAAEEVLRSSRDELELRVRERTAELERQVGERLRTEEALARTEEQLRHAQKMEAIGRLAGGVAHDFNNLLSVVLGYSDLILQQLPEHAPVRRHVEQINRAGSRAVDLTRHLLAFSRRQVLTPRVLDLNEVLRGLADMLSRLVGEDVEMVLRTAPDLALVEADPSQIEQVVMNLLVNARDAMPAGGRLVIETRNVMLDAAFKATHLGAEEGPHVLLAVSDTGMGMDKATMARIFEPFFTTKELGKGTGLGLSTVFGIVKQSGGLIWVSSDPGEGTRFEVYLPASRATHAHAADEHASVGAGVRGSETILVVEDEAQVLGLASTCLRGLGYRVLEALGPSDALVRAEACREPIHLLLTDMVMPGMTGTALASQLRRHYPGLRVLFMSGHLDDDTWRQSPLGHGDIFLQKPLTPALLAVRTREALDAAPARTADADL